MNTAKKYYDSELNPCTIHQMIKREPQWAASRIQQGEKALEMLAQLKLDHGNWIESLRYRLASGGFSFQHDDFFKLKEIVPDIQKLFKIK